MNRRTDDRVEVELPCKVWHPRAMRFVAGTTRDLSREGAHVTLRGGVPFAPGERILIGLSAHAGAIVRRSADLIEGVVVRAGVEEGKVAVAVHFCGGEADRAEAIANSSEAA
jgi:hypothetical protein